MSDTFENGACLFSEVRTRVLVVPLTRPSSAGVPPMCGRTGRVGSSRIWQMFSFILQELTFRNSFWALVHQFGTPANATFIVALAGVINP